MKLARIPRLLKILIALYLAYLALICLVATPLLNIFAPKIYREQTGAELKLEKIIWLNPFTLCATLKQASSVNADNTPFWSLDEIDINISIASIWRRHLVLDALALRGLSLQIDQTTAERYNFSDILDYRAKRFPITPDEAKDLKTTSEKTFPVEIKQFIFTATHFGYKAPYAAEPINLAADNFSFVLSNFSTLAEISAQPESTKNSTAKKPVLMPVHGDGIDIQTQQLKIDFLREHEPFSTSLHDLKIALPAFSTVAAQGKNNYSVNISDATGGHVRIDGAADLADHRASGTVQIQALNLLPAWQYLSDKLAFTAQRATLDGAINFNLDWNEALIYRIQNSQLALRDLQLQSRDDPETSAKQSALRVEGIEVDSTQPSVHIVRAMIEKTELHGWNRDTKVSLLDMIKFRGSDESSQPSSWQVVIDNIDVADGSIYWRANQLDNRPFVIAPLAMHATNLHWPDPAPLQFKLTADIKSDASNEPIAAAFDGEIVPGDVSGKINGTIAHVPLVLGNTFLHRQMHATIVGGTLNTKFALTLDKAQPVQLQSDGAVEHFELQITPSAPANTKASIDTGKLVAWNKLEWQQLAAAPTQQRLTIKNVILTQPWMQFRINTDGTNNFQQLLVQSAPSSSNISANTSKMKKTDSTDHKKIAISSSAGANKPWQFAIDTIHIDQAAIDFRDASLTSAFRTNITNLSGDIFGLDSGKEKAAKVALKGTVDGYAPVALSGTVNPFTAQPALNITLDITNLDLASLTPYSGTYAGYQIDGGRLTVQLAYTLEDGRIKGTNHIIVNDMKLGKQVSGPKVMDLPLRLAIYLLTDSKGVMDLGVDVTGNVDDPDFSVSSIIWKAFRNLIVKTATSPFRALAKLAGSDRDDLDRVEFQDGSAQFKTGEEDKLHSINKALQQKDALKLNITGHVSPSHDLEALRDNTLSAQLIATGGITQTDIQQQSKNWQNAVTKQFKTRFPDIKAEQWQVMQMNDAMRDNIELPANALQDLAAQRSVAVKQALVTDLGLAADRAFVTPVDLGADKSPGTTATMAVE